MKEKFRKNRRGRFGLAYAGGCWNVIPQRINGEYLNGYFFGVWFIGWIR